MALLERDAFLDQLATLMVDARHGRGRVVLIVGEAGIGKTSLVDAFCARVSTTTRVLWGTCDPIAPPRPFTPIVDIADRLGGDLRRALIEGDRDRVLDSFLAVLRRVDAPPALVILDDLHWADEATLDLFQVVARRVSRMPALLIGTYRDHDVGRDHPLRVALGDVPTSALTEIRLPPLSVAAVHRMCAGRADGVALHRATAGNPFFVTEVLAADPPAIDGVPATVRDAVLGRQARLSAAARHVLRAAAVLGPGSAVRTVLEVADEGRDALDECLGHALLGLHEGLVSFRHELARRAVVDVLPGDEVVRLNRRALEVLRAPAPIDWPRLARHAIAAGDVTAVIELAPAAGRHAEGLGAHREAAAFYEAALEHADRFGDRERAELLERFAREASLVDRVPSAIEAQRAALAAWRRVGDRVREGVCLTDLSGMLWLAGEGEAAMSTATAAADLLAEAAPDSPALAWAWSVVAQRIVVSGGDDRRAVEAATRAMDLAERQGNERVAVHTQTTLAVARIFLGDADGWSMLEGAVARARAANLAEESVRAMVNLVEAARDLRRYALAERYLADATAYLEDHDFVLYHHLLRSRVAALELEAGRWDAAVAHAGVLLDLAAPANPIRARALTVRGLVRARRSEPGAWTDLDAALSLSEAEPQDLLPLHAARAEAAWLEGRDAQARAEAARGLAVGGRELSRWWWRELAFWGWRAGSEGPLPHPDERPYWLQASGRPVEAAAEWATIGAPYQEALALADSDVEADLRQALRTLNALGARAMARRVTAALHARGAARIDRGPRAQTRANPAQLTARQLEILALLAEGLGNSEIATRLVISGKTVDHHVSAILAKLAVPNRTTAADVARRLGLAGTASEDGDVAGTR